MPNQARRQEDASIAAEMDASYQVFKWPSVNDNVQLRAVSVCSPPVWDVLFM